MWRFAAHNPSTLSCIIRRVGPMTWKLRSALLEGFFLALWPGSIRIWSAGGIMGFPRLVYSPRYSRGGRRDADYLPQLCRVRSFYTIVCTNWMNLFNTVGRLYQMVGLLMEKLRRPSTVRAHSTCSISALTDCRCRWHYTGSKAAKVVLYYNSWHDDSLNSAMLRSRSLHV